jgi:site-specific DNA-methyltransferase (adenine-specific)
MVNSLINEDCISGIARLEDGSVDAIITDPPYNISADNRFYTMKTGNRTGIDFGEWDKGFDQTTWLELALPKLKKGGTLIVFNAWKVLGEYYTVLEGKGCSVKEMLTWYKPNPMPRNVDRLYVTSCEFAVWAVKGKGWTFNRQRLTYENTVFTYTSPSKQERIHPTQKPLELMRSLVKIHTNVGDLVLDPFSGSGTTALASLGLQRNFIGFEISPEYFDKTHKRLFKESVASGELNGSSIQLYHKMPTRLN